MATPAYYKRKGEHEDESPTKRGRVEPPPLALVQYDGDDFGDVSLQPLPPSIPSPFEKSCSDFDRLMLANFFQYDQNVQEAFAHFRTNPNVLGFREEVRSVCDGQHVAWADPSGPSIFDPGEGLLLNNVDGTSGIIRFRRVTRTGPNNKKPSAWFLYVQAGLDIKINNQLVDSSIDAILGPVPSFSILQYGPRVVFLYSTRVAADYFPLPAMPGSSPGGANRKQLLQLRLRSAIAAGLARKEALKWEGWEAGAEVIKSEHEKLARKTAQEAQQRFQKEIARQVAEKRQLEQEELARKTAQEDQQRFQEEIARQKAEEAQRRLEEAKRKAKKEQERAAAAAAAAAEEERNSKAVLMAERLPTDVPPCEYFQWRLREWLEIQSRTGIVSEHPIPKLGPTLPDWLPNPPGIPDLEWLEDDQIWLAISSVTTAIDLENGHSFGQLSHITGQACKNRFLQPHDHFIGQRREMYLPWNIINRHWILVRVRMTPSGPLITYNDSMGSGGNHAREMEIRIAVRHTRWLGGTIGDQFAVNRVEYEPSSPQGNGFGCGYFTVLNAWCYALGLEPTRKRTTVFRRSYGLIAMLNLAIAGLMDSSTIHAFLICTGFVHPGSTIAPDRHFSNTVPFVRENDLGYYIEERMRMKAWPGVPRISPHIVRSIVEHCGLWPAEEIEGKMVLLEAYYQWLEYNGIPREPITPPLSPVSPTTVRLAVEEARNSDMANVYVPDDSTDLRQIFDVYRTLLRSNGILTHVRNVRSDQKSNAAPLANVEESPGPVYRGEAHTALERCDNLPMRGYLEDETVLQIRGRERFLPLPAPPPSQPEDEGDGEDGDEKEEEEEQPKKKKSIFSFSLITGKMGKFKTKKEGKK